MAVFGQTVHAKPIVKDARVGQHENATRFVLDLSETVPFRIFTLKDPYRLVVDLMGAGWALDDSQLALNSGLISAIRFGQFQTETARIVVDLRAPAKVTQAFILPPGKSADYRLVIDLSQVTENSFTPSALNTAAASESASAQRQASDQNGPAEAATASAAARGIFLPAPPRPSLMPVSKKPFLIVIDAGHGGADPGAVAEDGTYEKDVTLAAAHALEVMLLERGYNVVLSRRGDKYLSLSARTELAQQRNADLFISLHADRHKNRAVRGASVYTLSEKASDAETEALAARENEVDSLFDVNNSEEYEEDVRKILISLVQRATMTCSAMFAGELIPELKKSTRLLGRTHRFAGFRVLKAPTCLPCWWKWAICRISRTVSYCRQRRGGTRSCEASRWRSKIIFYAMRPARKRHKTRHILAIDIYIPTFPIYHPNSWKSYHFPTAKGTVSPMQPSDGMILVIGPRLEGHSVIFLAIQTHLSCRFLLAVDSLGLRRSGSSSQIINQAQDFPEQVPRHRHLSQLERNVAAMSDNLSPDLHQLVAQRRHRPVLHLLRQSQCPHEVAQIVGQGVKLEPNGIVAELRQTGRS